MDLPKEEPHHQCCCVCLEGLTTRTYCYTACNHYFHFDCFSSWTKRNATCPVCRSAVDRCYLVS